ncbi:MAG: chromosomal replication initiator protein DnaA [Clostridia bacterium]|nr:chromosomal replication initiator protein DnaA [Clostridia bacterium]
MDYNKIWADIQDAIMRSILNEVSYKIHIKSAVPVQFNNSVFTISVSNQINKTMIDFRFKNIIEGILEAYTGQKITLNTILEEDKEEFLKKSLIDEKQPIKPSSIGLNEKHTFENFVIGSSNQLAAAAAISASENPGRIYNPLFIYGNSGLGKTHLMCAMGNKMINENPSLKVLYVTTETFTNEFVDCIKTHRMEIFRNKYRTVDVLLVDDVQFLINRDGTQEEFFHTFNDLYSLNKQIVLTSDKKPSDLITLEERLRTRFTQGLQIDISVPDYETRLAILRKKAEENNFDIDADILEYIADIIHSNVRELEGALMRLISMAQLEHKELTLENTKSTIDSILPTDGVVKITPDKIMDKVCIIYNVTKDDLIGKSRVRQLVVPRQVAMYLCSKLTHMNNSMIGNTFGGKDRTSVIHNVQKIESLLENDEELKRNIDYIIKDLKSL